MYRRPTTRASRAIQSLLAAVVLAGSLASCAPSPAPTPTIPAAPTAAPTTEASVPVIQPDGTAEDNLPVFTLITQQVWATESRASGRAYIDALVAAGFDRAMMQVTEDQSTVGNAAESIQFSVRWGETACLVGQVGPSTGEPVTAVLDQLAQGRCLVGNTAPIDW